MYILQTVKNKHKTNNKGQRKQRKEKRKERQHEIDKQWSLHSEPCMIAKQTVLAYIA